MITQEQMIDLINAEGRVRTADGDDLGSLKQVVVDDATGRPSWILVAIDAPGSSEALVPLSGATVNGGELHIPYSRTLVEGVPNMLDDRVLGPDQEEHLLRYYGLGVTGGTASVNDDHATSGMNAGTVLTRSEEQLRVGTEPRESGTVRVHKYIVTETVTETIPVRHEEIRIEHLPVDGAGEAPAAGPDVVRIGTPFDEGEYEIVLYEERPILELETVPVERITLTKETIADEETVTGNVQKEVIEAIELK